MRTWVVPAVIAGVIAAGLAGVGVAAARHDSPGSALSFPSPSPSDPPAVLNVFLNDDITPDQTQAVRDLLTHAPGVTKVEYEDKEAAYQRFKDLFEVSDPELVNSVDPGDLPASFRADVQRSALDDLRGPVEDMPGVETVQVPSDLSDRLPVPVPPRHT